MMKSYWLTKGTVYSPTDETYVEHMRRRIDVEYIKVKCEIKGHYFFDDLLQCPCGKARTFITSG